MKTIQRVSIVAVLMLGLLTSLWGQTPGTVAITGTIKNTDNQAVEFATVILKSVSDSTLTKGVLADTVGYFELAGIKPGQYILNVSALNYATFTSNAIALSDTTKTVNLGSYTLTPDTKTLQEVVVKGERPVVERVLGKLVLNVSNSFFKTATNALDVLKKAPGIRIDPQGAITIKGSVTPVVYIDGKQLPLTAEELKNLSSEDIDQVEVIANASARYDGETRAVINIKLKRDKTLGLKGSAYAGAFINRHYSGYESGISASFKTPRFMYYGRVGYYENNDFLREVGHRIVQDNSTRTTFDSDAFTHWRNRPLSYQGTIDYTINQNNTVGIMVKGTDNRQRDLTTNNTLILTESGTTGSPLQQLLPTNTLTQAHPTNIAIDANYRSTLSPAGNQLSVNLDYASYNTQKTQDLRSNYSNDVGSPLTFPSVLLGQFPSSISIKSAKADYSHPLGKTAKLDFGAKISHTQTDNELIYDTLAASGLLVRDLQRSNHFLYNEHIVAAYGLFSKEFAKTSFEAALRVEQTQSEGNSLTLDNVVKRQYMRWLPSFQLQHKFDDQHSIAFGFSRKLRRPSFYELNPFQFYTSPFEYSEGNPFLLPMTRNTTELSYTHKDITITATYRIDRDVIAQMPIQDVVTKVIRYTRTNLDKNQVIAVDVTAPFTINKWWKMQHTAVVYYVRTVSAFQNSSFDNRALSFILNGQQVFTLPNGYTLECSYDYSAPSASQFYRNKSYGTVNFSLQKNVLKGAGNIQINVSDVFNTYREAFYGQYEAVNVSTLQTRNVQQGSVRFTYNFGKSTFTRKNRSSGSSEEENRAR